MFVTIRRETSSSNTNLLDDAAISNQKFQIREAGTIEKLRLASNHAIELLAVEILPTTTTIVSSSMDGGIA